MSNILKRWIIFIWNYWRVSIKNPFKESKKSLKEISGEDNALVVSIFLALMANFFIIKIIEKLSPSNYLEWLGLALIICGILSIVL